MFTVHNVGMGDDGGPAVGDALCSFRTYAAAKSYAHNSAQDFYWGTVVVDERRAIVDWGDVWRQVGAGAEIAPPAYARRYQEKHP